MSQKIDMTLRSFFIFNSNLLHKEGDEHKKILFYHPADIELDCKVKDVGLSEAIIKFAGAFTSEDGCKGMHTQKTTQIYFQPEKGFWMIMTINVPKEIKMREGSEVAEYKGADVNDKVFRAVLRQCYQMFQLFAGSFNMCLIGETEQERIGNLKTKLDLFYSKYLLTLKLPAFDILIALRSIQYLPLEKFQFLRVHSLINMVKATFPVIKKCIFLYNEQLVWSEINPNDLYSIHEYLTTTLFPKAFQTDLRGGSVDRNFSSDFNQFGGFITGPENSHSTKAPKIYLGETKLLQSYFLVVYRVLNATICLIVDNQSELNDDFYLELHSLIGPQLSIIASEIGETFIKSPNSIQNKQFDMNEIGPKYLLLNELNLSDCGTLYLDHKRLNRSKIPFNVINLLADLYEENKVNSDGKYEEILIKSVNDFWIVKKSSNWRQFYVIIYNNKATLLDITSEAKKIFEQDIPNNVFF